MRTLAPDGASWHPRLGERQDTLSYLARAAGLAAAQGGHGFHGLRAPLEALKLATEGGPGPRESALSVAGASFYQPDHAEAVQRDRLEAIRKARGR